MRRSTLALITAGVLLLAACGQGEDPAVSPPDDGDPVGETDGAPDGSEGVDGDAPDGTDDGPSGRNGDLEAATAAAVDDLAGTAGAEPADVEVVTAEAVTWSDGALGCPEPDMMYTQALVPGYRIVLALDGDEVHYHGAEGELPRRCDAPEPPADDGV